MVEAEPLWSDDMIHESVDKVSFDVLHEGRIQRVVSGVMVEALVIDMRNANRIALAALAERAAPQAGAAVPQIVGMSEIIESLEFHHYVAGCVDDGCSPEWRATADALKALRPLQLRPATTGEEVQP